jgi:hypothetical protein
MRKPAYRGAKQVKEMSGSVTSVFGEPDDFQPALRADGVLNLLVTGHGQFRSRLTQVALRHLHLSAGDEHLSRIAFVAVPADMFLVLLAIDDRPAPIWGGMEMRVGELITLGAGQRVHTRTLPLGRHSATGRGPHPIWPRLDRSQVCCSVRRTLATPARRSAPLPSSSGPQSRSSVGSVRRH